MVVKVDYNKEWCDERHDKIDLEFKVVRDRMNGFDKKLWAILIFLALNFAAISFVGVLVKAMAK